MLKGMGFCSIHTVLLTLISASFRYSTWRAVCIPTGGGVSITSRNSSGVAAADHSPLPQGCQTDTACPTVTAEGSAAR